MRLANITTFADRCRAWLRPKRPAAEEKRSAPLPPLGTRKIRIQIPPSDARGIADVLDAETGQTLPCRSFRLCAHAEFGVELMIDFVDFEAAVVGTWECKLVEERPL